MFFLLCMVVLLLLTVTFQILISLSIILCSLVEKVVLHGNTFKRLTEARLVLLQVVVINCFAIWIIRIS